MQDITAMERRAALERTFFHDLNNTLMALDGVSRFLGSGEPAEREETAAKVRELVDQLANEVSVQRELLGEPAGYQLSLQKITTRAITHRIGDLFASHPAAEGKELAFPRGNGERHLTTDVTLLLRILTNMLVNAFEATGEGGRVDLWVEGEDDGLSFCVRNSARIPEAVALRVFQRHFSTKEGSGRGIGTYSMKLFGEDLLGGKVDFTSSAEEGTVFRLRLPA
jgi:signal transduction histidine kinase